MILIRFIIESICWIRTRHQFEFHHNIYGDEINRCGGYRSLWECTHCEKLVWRKELRPTIEEGRNIAQELFNECACGNVAEIGSNRCIDCNEAR